MLVGFGSLELSYIFLVGVFLVGLWLGVIVLRCEFDDL